MILVYGVFHLYLSFYETYLKQLSMWKTLAGAAVSCFQHLFINEIFEIGNSWSDSDQPDGCPNHLIF